MANLDELYDEAIELKESGRMDEAVAKLEALAEQAPEFALAHAGLSAFYSKLERHEEAVEHAQRVCQLEPDDPFSFIAMSIVSQKAGKLAEAEAAMGQAIEKQWSAVQDNA